MGLPASSTRQPARSTLIDSRVIRSTLSSALLWIWPLALFGLDGARVPVVCDCLLRRISLALFTLGALGASTGLAGENADVQIGFGSSTPLCGLTGGDQLPTEVELVAMLGVSRSVLREAVAALRSAGVLESRQGAGVFFFGTPKKNPPPWVFN